MLAYTPSRSPCPIARTSRILGDRWAMLILRDAFLGAERFQDFTRHSPISRAALSSRLAILVEAGVLERDPPEGRKAVYRLTAAGRALEPIFADLRSWGDKFVPIAD